MGAVLKQVQNVLNLVGVRYDKYLTSFDDDSAFFFRFRKRITHALPVAVISFGRVYFASKYMVGGSK